MCASTSLVSSPWTSILNLASKNWSPGWYPWFKEYTLGSNNFHIRIFRCIMTYFPPNQVYFLFIDNPERAVPDTLVVLLVVFFIVTQSAGNYWSTMPCQMINDLSNTICSVMMKDQGKVHILNINMISWSIAPIYVLFKQVVI